MTVLNLFRGPRTWKPKHGAQPVPADGPKKPAFHRACNGCGVCCVAEPCTIARVLIEGAGEKGPCPALEWAHGRSWCGMVLRPAYYSAAVREGPYNEREASQMIQDDLGGMGSGCDSAPASGPDQFKGLTAAQYLERFG